MHLSSLLRDRASSTWRAIALAATVLALLVPSLLGLAAPNAVTINRVYVTDIRDAVFVVSWTTEAPADGQVDWGSTAALGNTAADTAANSTIHRVIVPASGALAAGTAYYFRVRSGGAIADNAGDYYRVTTGQTLGIPEPGRTVWGYVFRSDGVTPAGNAVVYLQLRDANASGSPGVSQWATARANSVGAWGYTLGNIRTQNGVAYFAFSDGSDSLHLIARGGATAAVETLVATPASYPSGWVQLPNLILADPSDAQAPRATAGLQGSNDVRLTWTHATTNADYAVWRSSSPYFQPGATGSHRRTDVAPPLTGSDLGYTDFGAAGNPAANCFYAVMGYDLAGVPAPTTSWVAAFGYALQPGALP